MPPPKTRTIPLAHVDQHPMALLNAFLPARSNALLRKLFFDALCDRLNLSIAPTGHHYEKVRVVDLLADIDDFHALGTACPKPPGR